MLVLTPIELVEIFPEAKGIVVRNLGIWKKYKKDVAGLYSDLLNELLKQVYQNGNEVEDGARFMQKYFYDRPMKEIDGHVKRLEHLKMLYENVGKPVKEGAVTDADIACAKAVPVTQYLELNRSGFFVCIFHDDRHPSAKYYADQNKMYCFVCGKGFDVIDVVQKLRGVEFLEAVKIILGR